MRNLNPKNVMLNWETPSRRGGSKGRDLPKDFIHLQYTTKDNSNYKYKKTQMVFHKSSLVNFYDYDITQDNPDEVLKIALSFEKDRLIVAFNPKEGTPYFKLSKTGKMRAMNNQAIVEKIYDFFKLDKKKSNYFLKAYYWAELNGMELYVLTPQDFETMQPIFEDEKKGELNIHA